MYSNYDFYQSNDAGYRLQGGEVRMQDDRKGIVISRAVMEALVKPLIDNYRYYNKGENPDYISIPDMTRKWMYGVPVRIRKEGE